MDPEEATYLIEDLRSEKDDLEKDIESLKKNLDELRGALREASARLERTIDDLKDVKRDLDWHA